MQIRHASAVDQAFIRALCEEVFSHYGGNAGDSCASYIKDPYSVTLIAEDPNDLGPLGFAVIHLLPLRAYLAALATIPQRRRCGIARRLLVECMNLAEQRAAGQPLLLDLHVGESNQAAMALFAEFGFAKVSWTDLRYESGELAVHMVTMLHMDKLKND